MVDNSSFKDKVDEILSNRYMLLSEVSTEHSLMESDENLLKEHNESIADLLKNYVISSDKSQKHKRGMKIAFFIITMFIIFILNISFVVTIFVGLYMQHIGNAGILDLLAPIIASFSSVVISIMVIPKIIAEYLFDKNEDDRLSNMVSNMQDYDKELRSNRDSA